ncbi:hypothetical protein EWB00_009325 [Schistosoma japonicum]|uniref:Uncharacterized protein n=1 Tax=Schistosoma japonicum TaxID=6182 RepID=A0A4Z2CMA0_SCHJA|nr:hypothetical protein EWB00_009325 [Schistosoma japonicum]
MSSESANFKIGGQIDRYGRHKPTKSKCKTLGKEKKYSSKINDNRFDVKGDLYDRHQHEGIGDFQANSSHVSVKSKTKEENGKPNSRNSDQNSNSYTNTSNRQVTMNWGT